jgi:hypothetical protein
MPAMTARIMFVVSLVYISLIMPLTELSVMAKTDIIKKE